MFKAIKRMFSNHRIEPTVQEEIARMRFYTDDMVELQKKLGHPLFVCDDMQDGHPNNFLLSDFPVEHIAFTQAHYTMLKHDLGFKSYPLVFEKPLDRHNPPPIHAIKGELRIVSHTRLNSLDGHRENGVSFIRKLVPIIIPCKELFFKDRAHAEAVFGHNVGKCLVKDQGVYRTEAWMYFAVPEYWDQILWKVSAPVITHIAKNELIKRCYYFTPQEYLPPHLRPDPDVPF